MTTSTTNATNTTANDDLFDTADPFSAAMEAVERPNDGIYFGEVSTVDAWFCILEKGVGKKVFDPTQHRLDQRRTAIEIAITPLQGSFEVKRDTIDTSRDWLKITLPSLRAIGVPLGKLRGRFVKVQLVPTGDTYINKNGDRKDRTALKFLAAYVDREACEAAQADYRGEATNGDVAIVGAGGIVVEDLPY